jgi:putative MFS transporter
MIAPLSVPLLLGAGGMVLVFGVFGVAFLLAAGAALFLPEHAGLALES